MSALVELAAKATLLLGFAGLVVTLMRRATASSRHLVWIGAFCAIALLPVARVGLPAWRIGVFPAPAPSATAPSAFLPQPIVLSTGDQRPMPAVGRWPPEVPKPAPRPWLSVSASDFAIGVWLIGIIALVVRSVSGWLALRRSVRLAAPVTDPAVLEKIDQARTCLRVTRPVTLLSDAADGLPCTFGIWRPAILLPAAMLRTDAASAARLEHVLAHEMAHIARGDAMTEGVMRIAVFVHWFNPLMWFGARLARIERERAADDAVLAGGTRPSDYARDLVTIASTRFRRPESGAIAMAASALERRVRAILDEGVSRGRHSKASLVAALVLPVAMLPLSAAKLVARTPAPIVIAETAPVPTVVPTPSVALVQTSREPSKKAEAATQVQQTTTPQTTTPQTPTPQQQTTQNDGGVSERVGMLRQVLERSQRLLKDTRTKVEIGTVAPIDTVAFETAVAQMEQAVLAASRPNGLAPLTADQLATVRARFATETKYLDAATIRYDNGLLTVADMVGALRNAQNAVTAPISMAPSTGAYYWQQSNPADAMFTTVNFPGSTDADRNSARALYALLTGRVNSITGVNTAVLEPLSDAALLTALKNGANVTTPEAVRADGLIALAQRYALTPEMVSAYVAAATSIQTESIRARVFAQPIRVKPGSSK